MSPIQELADQRPPRLLSILLGLVVGLIVAWGIGAITDAVQRGPHVRRGASTIVSAQVGRDQIQLRCNGACDVFTIDGLASGPKVQSAGAAQ
jgi:hypothetical protein